MGRPRGQAGKGGKAVAASLESGLASWASVLSTPGGSATADEVRAFISAHYGVDGALSKLTSERDENYRITLADGTERLFKVTHAAEAPSIVDFQTRALLHIAAADPAVPVPRVVPTRAGELTAALIGSDARTRQARMFTFLQGTPLSSLPPTRRHATELGLFAARLDGTLSNFHHPASRHELLWDIQHAANTRGLLEQTRSPADRDLCERALDAFESQVAPGLGALRAQVIHNDLNPHNVLMNPTTGELAGVIDFGDMVHAPLIDEVAVACAYLCAANDEPLGSIPEFVAAYHRVMPLNHLELGLLPRLIATRHAITVAITNWRAARYPENRDYILRNQRAALLGLEKLSSQPAERLREHLWDVCRG